jgi:hypothetical protein
MIRFFTAVILGCWDSFLDVVLGPKIEDDAAREFAAMQKFVDVPGAGSPIRRHWGDRIVDDSHLR